MKTKAHTIYKNKAGKRLAGATTVINANLGWSKDALIAWARREAMAGNDPDKMRDEAAESGTLGYEYIRCHLIGEEVDTSDYSANQIDGAENAFIAFLDFEKAHDLEVIATELVLVSEEYQYGGTLDLVCYLDGIKSLIDFKTGSGVYPEHRIQLAAYEHLWYENKGEALEKWIVQLGKKDGSLHPHKYNGLKAEWEVFQHLLALHRLKKEVK